MAWQTVVAVRPVVRTSSTTIRMPAGSWRPAVVNRNPGIRSRNLAARDWPAWGRPPPRRSACTRGRCSLEATAPAMTVAWSTPRWTRRQRGMGTGTTATALSSRPRCSNRRTSDSRFPRCKPTSQRRRNFKAAMGSARSVHRPSRATAAHGIDLCRHRRQPTSTLPSAAPPPQRRHQRSAKGRANSRQADGPAKTTTQATAPARARRHVESACPAASSTGASNSACAAQEP